MSAAGPAFVRRAFEPEGWNRMPCGGPEVWTIPLDDPRVLARGRAGLSRAGEALTNGDWIYAFTVHAAGEITRRFCAGRSTAGERLRDWGEGPLECVINKYKPAHAIALFAYTSAENEG